MRCIHVYTSVGVYEPQISIFNSVSSFVFKPEQLPTFIVASRIQNLTLQLPSVIEIGEIVTLEYNIVHGSNVIETWWINNKIFTDPKLEIKSQGPFNITVLLENALGTATATHLMTSEMRLKTVGFSKKLKLFYRLGDAVNFGVQIFPSAATYMVELVVAMGDGAVYNSRDIEHVYSNTGVFTILATASNNLSNVASGQTLAVQDTILRVSIKGSFVAVPGQQSVFSAEVQQKFSNDITGDLKFKWVLEDEVLEQDSSEINLLFDKEGQYKLSVEVYNDISSSEVSEELVITYATSCNPPQVSISGPEELSLTKDTSYRLEVDIRPRCPSRHAIKWFVLLLSRVEVYSINGSTTFTIPMKDLQSRSYIIRVQASSEVRPSVYGTDEILLTVTEDPFIPILNYPMYFDVSINKPYTITLENSVIANNSLLLTDFMFNWSCAPLEKSMETCSDLTLDRKEHYIDIKFSKSGRVKVSVDVLRDEIKHATTFITFTIMQFLIPEVKIVISDITSLAVTKELRALVNCHLNNVSCNGAVTSWKITKISQQVCSGSEETAVTQETLTLTASTNGFSLEANGLVVGKDIFDKGASYKLEGCVLSICAGMLRVVFIN